MKTKLSELIQENAELEAALEQGDAVVLKQIMKFLSLHPLSSSDTQILRKDLIGMAQEAKLRGMRFQDIIGEDIQSFCESVLDNVKHNKTEYMLRRLSDWLICIFFWYLGEWGLCYSFPQVYDVKIGWLLVVVFASVCRFFVRVYFERKTIFVNGNSPAVRRSNDFTLQIFFAALLAILLIPGGYRKTVLFSVPGLISACALAAIALIARALYLVSRNSKGR